MKTELYISWRYLSTRRKEKFVSMIGAISILGVAIGVMALIVVIAVMTGFDNDLRDKMVGNYSHLNISGYKLITKAEYETIINKISGNLDFAGMSPYLQGQSLLKIEKGFFAVSMRGIEPQTETQVTKIKQYLIKGDLASLGQNSVIIGKELALYLGLDLDKEIVIFSPLRKEYTLKIVGIFNSGMYDYDLNLIFTDLATAQNILGLSDQISGIAIKLANLYAADRVKAQLAKQLDFEYNIKTWTEMNPNFFAALQLEKLTMFIILTLIILVASFNIASTLIVMVVEKTKDIGILKALGMNQDRVRNIFTYQGMIIGACGTVLGASSGIILCTFLKKYQFIKLPKDIYYIDRLPVQIQFWPDVILIVGVAMLIALIATVYPARKAAGLKPVEALRYE